MSTSATTPKLHHRTLRHTNRISSLLADKRLIILVLATIVGAAIFWIQSRYPALMHKAELSGVITMQDSLVHVATVDNLTVDDYWVNIKNSFINWVMANRRGMTFGVVIGAAFLTIFRYVPTFSSTNPIINGLYGMAAGSPLGVCSNCVAPIMKGVYETGHRAELALAMMFSSPTLNIIVLTMVFSIFPLEIALLKVSTTLILTMIFIPALTRLLPLKKPEMLNNINKVEICSLDARKRINENWLQALKGALHDYTKNLFYITTRTVPLMFVAGALGAAISYTLPLEEWMDQDLSYIKLAGLSLLATFLPLPVAVDVMFAHSFMNAGASIGFVMLMLVTLGSYSIYSFFIVWQTMGMRIAVALYLCVAALGFLSAILAIII